MPLLGQKFEDKIFDDIEDITYPCLYMIFSFLGNIHLSYHFEDLEDSGTPGRLLCLLRQVFQFDPSVGNVSTRAFSVSIVSHGRTLSAVRSHCSLSTSRTIDNVHALNHLAKTTSTIPIPVLSHCHKVSKTKNMRA